MPHGDTTRHVNGDRGVEMYKAAVHFHKGERMPIDGYGRSWDQCWRALGVWDRLSLGRNRLLMLRTK